MANAFAAFATTAGDHHPARLSTIVWYVLTDFPGLLLWMVPGAIVWLIGEVFILRAAASRQERSPRGLQIHLVGLSLFMLGLTAAGVVTAAVHANWLVAAVVVSAFLPIAVYFGVLAVKQAPH